MKKGRRAAREKGGIRKMDQKKLERHTLAMLIHDGRSMRGSSDPPDRYRTHEVM